MMEEETYTRKEIMETINVSENTIRMWKVKFNTVGIDAFKESKTWRFYTNEQKIATVRYYLDLVTTAEALSNH